MNRLLLEDVLHLFSWIDIRFLSNQLLVLVVVGRLNTQTLSVDFQPGTGDDPSVYSGTTHDATTGSLIPISSSNPFRPPSSYSTSQDPHLFR